MRVLKSVLNRPHFICALLSVWGIEKCKQKSLTDEKTPGGATTGANPSNSTPSPGPSSTSTTPPAGTAAAMECSEYQVNVDNTCQDLIPIHSWYNASTGKHVFTKLGPNDCSKPLCGSLDLTGMSYEMIRFYALAQITNYSPTTNPSHGKFSPFKIDDGQVYGISTGKLGQQIAYQLRIYQKLSGQQISDVFLSYYDCQSTATLSPQGVTECQILKTWVLKETSTGYVLPPKSTDNTQKITKSFSPATAVAPTVPSTSTGTGTGVIHVGNNPAAGL